MQNLDWALRRTRQRSMFYACDEKNYILDDRQIVILIRQPDGNRSQNVIGFIINMGTEGELCPN